MTDRWQALSTQAGRGRLVPFGPFHDRLPARFTTVFEHAEHPLRATVAASFDGTDRVRVDALTLERTDGGSVTPEDTTRVQLAQLVHNAAMNAVKHGAGGAVAQGGRKHDGPPDDDELRTLARMYWLYYVTWGKPRQYVMSAFELPRTTATRWIHRARDLYGLPGPHDEQEA